MWSLQSRSVNKQSKNTKLIRCGHFKVPDYLNQVTSSVVAYITFDRTPSIWKAFPPSGFANAQLDLHPVRKTSCKCGTGKASLLSGSAYACVGWKAGHIPCRIDGIYLPWTQARLSFLCQTGLSPLEKWILNRNPEYTLRHMGCVQQLTRKLLCPHLQKQIHPLKLRRSPKENNQNW